MWLGGFGSFCCSSPRKSARIRPVAWWCPYESARQDRAMRETAEAIDSEASNWVSRIDRGLTDKEEVSLGKWLSADIRRRGALARAQAVWQDLDRAQVFRIADD